MIGPRSAEKDPVPHAQEIDRDSFIEREESLLSLKEGDLGSGIRTTRVPHSSIRRRTAEHMVLSKTTSAHVYATLDVDFENILRVRRENRDGWRASEGFGLSYLPFVTSAVIMAIAEFPELNSQFEEHELVIHHEIAIGIAVDLDFKGLIVPAIRNAQLKGFRQIAREIHDLATRAKARKLTAGEVAGGTFTITNPVSLGRE